MLEDPQRPERVARRLLIWLAEAEPVEQEMSTPVDTLAERLGLDVAHFHPIGRRAGTLGWLEPGERLIYLREGLPEPTRRFTLAHEIGHAVLHRPGGLDRLFSQDSVAYPETSLDAALAGCDGTDLDEPLDQLVAGDETLRPGQAYSARAQRESDANAFAAALLLPVDRLMHAYRMAADERRSTGHLDLHSLAERFGVSDDVLLRRLTALLTPSTLLSTSNVLEAANVVGEAGPLPVSTKRSNAQLDPSQRAAASAATPALIVAGPGTGKTSTLVGRVRYLVEDEGVPPEHILALTFSNRAAREMRERVSAALGVSTYDAAPPPPLPTISTFHAFCGDVLRKYAPLIGLRPDFRLLTETEGYFLLRRMAANLPLSHYQPLATPAMHFPTLLRAISRAKDELAGPERYAEVAREMAARATTDEERLAADRALEVAAVYAAYQAALRERGDPDFGDLIRLTVRLLQEHPTVLADIRAEYQQLLVDEFQDINRAMGVLLRTLAGPDGPLWAVGDADQAIYRFRGASPANLARFTNDYPGAVTHTLRHNYRSVPDVLEAAAALAGGFLSGGRRAPLASSRSITDSPAITVTTAPTEDDELAGLVHAIRTRAEAGRMFGEQVVLCRSRRQAQRVAEVLIAAGIPSRMPTPLLQQDDVKDVLAVISLLADSSGAGLLRAGAVPDHAFSLDDARAILAEARAQQVSPLTVLNADLERVPDLSAQGRTGLRVLTAILAELRQAADVMSGLAHYVFGLTSLGLRLVEAAPSTGENASRGEATDVRAHAARIAQVLALARAFEDQRHADVAAGQQSYAAHERADWPGFLDYIRVVSALRQEGASALEDVVAGGDGVRVLTVHASKGLEFPVVYLPGLAERRFPVQRRGDLAPPLAGISEDETAEAHDPAAHLAEEACLFYVALTRARDELVLSYAERYGRMRYRPSPFLAPIEARMGSRLVREQWSMPSSTGIHLPPPPSSHSVMAETLTMLTPSAGPFRQSAIETFERCPRQYAYRYVYGLRPREIGLATLRRALHDTLHTLQERVSRTQTGDCGESEPLALHVALGLFEDHWASALERELSSGGTGTPDSQPSAAPPNAFVEVYRRHGRHVVERAWSSLILADDASVNPPAVPLPPATLSQQSEYDRSVTVHVGRHDVAVTLDRVERPLHSLSRVGATAGAGAHKGKNDSTNTNDGAEPARFVRHRLGRSASRSPDLRSLLYSLAAEQRSASAPAELYQHNLTTGELEPVTLNDRTRQRLREALADVLDGMASGYYPARPDPSNCQTCPFLLICPA